MRYLLFYSSIRGPLLLKFDSQLVFCLQTSPVHQEGHSKCPTSTLKVSLWTGRYLTMMEDNLLRNMLWTKWTKPLADGHQLARLKVSFIFYYQVARAFPGKLIITQYRFRLLQKSSLIAYLVPYCTILYY
jgi:hypothetical protein